MTSLPAPPSKPEAPTLDAKGRERPRFLLSFPADQNLDALVQAFERGDYRTVRAEAPKLASETSDAEVRAAAEELLRRIQPEPALAYLLALAVALLLFLVLHAYTR